MAIRIKRPGLLTTIQDLGRVGYRSQAVPVSGAMDVLSARIANICVGNNECNAVIEFTQGGASFVTENDVLLALSGDGANISCGDLKLPSHKPVFIPAGTIVSLNHTKSEIRAYLAVAGGWDIPEVLGSRSTFLTAKIGGLNGRCLKEGDQLANAANLTPLSDTLWNQLKGGIINYPKWCIARDLFLPTNRKTIHVLAGREFGWFTEPSVKDFFSAPYSIGNNSNRMGYQLQGIAMERVAESELLSAAVTPGTIQVTNNGDLIMLMADCQTTGGYPRIAQVASVDLPFCSQLKPGDEIYFKEITLKEAERLYFEREMDLKKLRWAIGMRYGL